MIDSLAVTSETTSWMGKGACAGDSDLFFAPFAERPEARVRREGKARVICETCNVISPCRPTRVATSSSASGVASPSLSVQLRVMRPPRRSSAAERWPRPEPPRHSAEQSESIRLAQLRMRELLRA